VNSDFSAIHSMFNANSSVFEKATAGIPDEKWLIQPGEDSNHLLFIAGHVVVHRAFVPKYLDLEWSAPWAGLFSPGAKRVAPDRYPSVSEIQKAWGEVSEKLMAALPKATPELAVQPVPKERPSLNGTVGGAIGLLCFHETYHVGQMGCLRKWLGFGPSVG
jgi:uncharacterized damage-inducible protein DinB